MRITLSVLFAFIVAGCSSSSSNPNAKATANNINKIECQKFSDCQPTVFAQIDPSVDECVSRRNGMVTVDSNAEDACTSDQVSACESDLQNQDCTSEETAAVPDSCKGC